MYKVLIEIFYDKTSEENQMSSKKGMVDKVLYTC